MRISPRHYPHPVLTRLGNDVEGIFQASLDVQTTPTHFVLNFHTSTNDAALASLIRDGLVGFAAHVECPSSRFRRLISSRSEDFTLEIAAGDLDGNVHVCPFILALKELPAYKNPAFHDDYDGRTFAVRQGDTLAVGSELNFFAEKVCDSLKKVASIFKIIPNDKASAPAMDIDLGGDKIVVLLSRENFTTYKFMCGARHLRAVLSSMIIVPALTLLVERLKTPEMLEEHLDKRWFVAMERRYEDLGLSLGEHGGGTDSAVVLAQRLIGSPLTDGLKALKENEDAEDEEGTDG